MPRSARITSLLIGTDAGGMSVRNSIEAILEGVASANRLLDEQELSDDRIYRYLDEINATPVHFRWKYKLDEVLV